jgi:hypothetical protein
MKSPCGAKILLTCAVGGNFLLKKFHKNARLLRFSHISNAHFAKACNASLCSLYLLFKISIKELTRLLTLHFAKKYGKTAQGEGD